MRFIYAHFLEEGENLEYFMRSRVVPRPNIRHIVRKRLYEQYGCLYRQLSDAEERISGRRTDESTITHSVHKPVEKFASYQRAEATVNDLLRQFEEYWMDLHDYGMQARMKHYYEMPHHVLAAITCMAEQFGWAERIKLDGLHREFKTISKTFFEDLINDL